MLVRWPGKIPKGAVSDHAWGFWDIMPTFAEIAGQPAPAGLDGVSVVPALLGKKMAPENLMYWELPRYNAKTATFFDEVPMQAARMGDWKAVRPQPNAKLELYNLRRDPLEQKDISAENPAIVSQMETLLQGARVPPRPQKDPPQDFAKQI
jgi:arylsulfatase A-like enzyme